MEWLRQGNLECWWRYQVKELKFGRRSLTSLETCHPGLQVIAYKALSTSIIDFTILCGHRSKEEQDAHFEQGTTQLKWPNSKHNKFPSDAVDIVPWIRGKLSWNPLHCCFLAGILLTCAKELGYTLRWGGNWNMNLEPITDQTFQDLAHFEIVELFNKLPDLIA